MTAIDLPHPSILVLKYLKALWLSKNMWGCPLPQCCFLPDSSNVPSLSLIRLCGSARSSPERFSFLRCSRCRRTSCCSKGVNDSDAGSVNSGQFKPRGCVLTLGRTGCSGCRWRRAVMPVQRARGSSLMLYMQVRGSRGEPGKLDQYNVSVCTESPPSTCPAWSPTTTN